MLKNISLILQCSFKYTK